MGQKPTKLCVDEHGKPFMIPDAAAFFHVMRMPKEGKPGRPGYLCREGRRVVYSVDVEPDRVAAELPSGRYRYVFLDANGLPLGVTFMVVIEHLDDDRRAAEQARERAQHVDPRLEQLIATMNREIQALREEKNELLSMFREAMGAMRQFAEKTLEVNVELTKSIPKMAETVIRRRGEGMLEAAKEVKEIWDAAPEGENQLETVLNSPVVVGTAAALQQYVAKAARDGAEKAASNSNNGQRRESMAQRAARAGAAANERALQAGS